MVTYFLWFSKKTDNYADIHCTLQVACVGGVDVEGKGKKGAREVRDEGAQEAREDALLLALSLQFYGLPHRLPYRYISLSLWSCQKLGMPFDMPRTL